MWGHRNKWTRRARLLLEAYQIYVDSLCGSCGQSAFHAGDQMNTPWYRIAETHCLGCEVLEREQSQRDGERLPFGDRRYVQNTMGADLSRQRTD